MKFQLKALAAAMVLAAAVPAQAAMDLPQDLVNSTGNSSMVLAMFDRVANVSAVFDLGKNYSDFNKIGTSFADSNVDALGTSFSWSLTSGDYATAWSTFLPLVNLENVQWAVIGGDNFGAGAGNTSLIATLNQPEVTAITTYTTGAMKTQLAALQQQLGNAQFTSTQLFENHTQVANGGSVSNSATATQNITNYFGGNKANNAGSVVTANLGQSMAVFQLASATLNTAQPTNTIFANNARFTLSANGLLSYATDPVVQVPEADTWAMMLLGLGFMGFAARRKQA